MITPQSNSKLEIVIPSKGRADWDKQTTLRQLLSAVRTVTLVVPREEVSAYKSLLIDCGSMVRVVMCHWRQKSIGTTRRWITQSLFRDQKVVMFDDDLQFLVRPDMSSSRLEVASPLDLRKMLHRMEALLDDVPMVGISTRQQNIAYNSFLADVSNAFSTGAYALNLGTLRDTVKFGRLPLLENVDFTLRLFKAGYSNTVMFDYAWSHAINGNSKTGCNTYRTARMHAAAAQALQRAHPDYVRLIKAGVRNIEVKVEWVKSVEDGKNG